MLNSKLETLNAKEINAKTELKTEEITFRFSIPDSFRIQSSL